MPLKEWVTAVLERGAEEMTARVWQWWWLSQAGAGTVAPLSPCGSRMHVAALGGFSRGVEPSRQTWRWPRAMWVRTPHPCWLCRALEELVSLGMVMESQEDSPARAAGWVITKWGPRKDGAEKNTRLRL